MDSAVNHLKMEIRTLVTIMKANLMDQVSILLFRHLYMGKFFEI